VWLLVYELADYYGYDNYNSTLQPLVYELKMDFMGHFTIGTGGY